MGEFVRQRLTYANVMATIAVFIALGAGAYAVSLDRNQVKSKHLAKNTAKAKDIATGGVRSAEVADGAIGTSELGDGSVATGKIAAGAVGSEAVADSSIGAAEIGDGQVGSGEIGDGQVGAAETAAELGFRCPGGTRYHEGACIETSPRTADDWNTAHADCFDENRRLPTFAELQTFRNAPGITVADEWSGGFWTDGGSFALTVSSNGGLTARAVANDFPYRCAATATG